MPQSKVPSSKEIFITGSGYLSAYQVLFNAFVGTPGPFKNGGLLPPSMVCLAFGCELLLKCLLVFRGSTVPKDHSLRHLFNSLKQDDRAEIEKRYNEYEKNSRTIPAMKSKIGDFDSSLPAVLKEFSNTFDNWRYHFEKDHPNNITGLGIFSRSIQEYLLKIDPSFASPPK